jgi:hypothetical protein
VSADITIYPTIANEPHFKEGVTRLQDFMEQSIFENKARFICQSNPYVVAIYVSDKETLRILRGMVARLHARYQWGHLLIAGLRRASHELLEDISL